jgi:osmotically-inducible protein OsmY
MKTNVMKTDLDLREDVEEELLWEPSVLSTEIGVIVEDGIVTLTGSVDSYPEKWEAEKAALRVAGVKAVANEIDVRLSTSSFRTDEDIARAACDILEWNVSLPNDLQVVVEDGWVTLAGHVQWYYQKDTAGNAVKYLTGVRGVSNNITVKPRVTADDVQDRIEASMERHALLDANGIEVKTDDGKVTLKGKVFSWAEKQAAEEAAWSAPGVTEVDNQLELAF